MSASPADIRVYCQAEIARLQQLEQEQQQAIRDLQDQVMAVRGAINAYRDVIAQLEPEESP
jgi:Mg2+ and Co2+ transporter CorA